MRSFTRTLLLCAAFAFTALEAQVTKLNNNHGLQLVGLLDANRALFYSHGTKMLWISDGTPVGTYQITSKVTYDGFGTALNGRIYFRGYSTATGYELWRTDGTDAGTVLVQDINPGAASSNPNDRMLVLNNFIFFSAQTAAKGRELWKTDGTNEGTVLVKDIVSGTGSSNAEGLYKLTVAGNLLYFVTNTTLGEELWKTDGTADGTFPVRDINPGAASSQPVILGAYQNKLVFTANDGVHGFEPWITDGSLAGTQLIKDLEAGSPSSTVDQIVEFKGKMLFAGQEKVYGQELWISDGTPSGTTLLKDIQPGSLPGMPNLLNSIEANGLLLFTAFTEAQGLELWQTDGTTAGTKLFMDIEPGPGISYPFIFKPSLNGFGGPTRQLFQGNKFFFSAFNGATGFELYVSDGTPAGTRLVKDINTGYQDGLSNLAFFYTRDYLYFNAQTAAHGDELWRTDGTQSNTLLVADINATAGIGSGASPIVIVGNRLLLTGDDGDSGPAAIHDLYALNGIEQPLPIRITSFTGTAQPAGNLLQWKVAQATGFSRFEVWRSLDGNNFQSIGTVAFEPALANYQYTDKALPAGTKDFYYKLKLVDASGSARFTPVVKLSRAQHPHQSIQVAQTGSSHIQLVYQLNKAGASAEVRDLQGRMLQSSRLPLSSGTVLIPVSSVNRSSILLVVVRTPNGDIFSEKILLQ